MAERTTVPTHAHRGQQKKASRQRDRARPAPTHGSVEHLRELQRTAGNQAVMQLAQAGMLQAELGLGPSCEVVHEGPAVTPWHSGPVIQTERMSLDFGFFWVGEDTPTSVEDKGLERLSNEEFLRLKSEWEALRDSHASGKLSVTDEDEKQKKHERFPDNVVGLLGRLLFKKKGRGLLQGLIGGGKNNKKVEIAPLTDVSEVEHVEPKDKKAGLRNPETSEPGAGSDVKVFIDPALNDDTVKAFDGDFNLINMPAFLVLGHELIHAKHQTEGTAAPRELEPSHPEYHELEEEETISSGTLTENVLRGEHKLTGARFGHEGLDTRFPHQINVPQDLDTLDGLAQASNVAADVILGANKKLQELGLKENPKWLHQYLVEEQGALGKALSVGAGVDWEDWMNDVDKIAEFGGAIANSTLSSGEVFGDYVRKNLSEVLDGSGDAEDYIVSQDLGEQVRPLMEKTFSAALDTVPQLRGIILSRNKDIILDFIKEKGLEVLGQVAPDPILKVLLTIDADQVLEKSAVDPLEVIKAAQEYAQGIPVKGELTVPGATAHRMTKTEADEGDTLAAVAKNVSLNKIDMTKANPGVKWDTVAKGTWLIVPKA